MRILQRNVNSTWYDVVKVHFKFRCNILISGKIIKEMPGSVASGTLCRKVAGAGNFKKYNSAGVLRLDLGAT